MRRHEILNRLRGMRPTAEISELIEDIEREGVESEAEYATRLCEENKDKIQTKELIRLKKLIGLGFNFVAIEYLNSILEVRHG